MAADESSKSPRPFDVRTIKSFIALMNQQDIQEIDVREGPRFVRDGNLVTAAGVSAGIDMALWIIGQEHSPDFARKVQRAMEYYPAPPYTADV